MFNKNYFEKNKDSNYKSYKDMELLKKNYFQKIIKDIKIKKDFKILDIGCAYGYFLKLCEDNGCKTYGIDISKYAIKKAKKITKAKLYCYDVNNGLFFFKKNTFDLIIMFDVIEHLDSPFKILKEVKRVLKKNGIIIITTPNINSIDLFIKKIFGKDNKWHGFFDQTHKYIFCPESLKFIVKKYNFKIIKLETPFHSLPKILQNILNKTGLGGQIWLVAKK